MRIAVIGSTGQLGTDLVKALQEEHEVISLTHHDIEVADYDSCRILVKHNPSLIVNTAAFHKVDLCEEEPLKTFSVNTMGARNISVISRELGAISLFVSTDFVFDGSKNQPYTEDDQPNPLNTYGISKLAGELYTKQNPSHYIIRVASLFGVAGASGKGGNFIETMIAKAQKGEAITVVDDMWMSPTYTMDAAVTISKIVDSKLPFGTYHVTNEGYCTWFEFAKKIFRLSELDANLSAMKTDQLHPKAVRPRFSALKSVRLSKFNIRTREWEEALKDYLTQKGYLMTRT
jgi:dTDP-4-dehydrorhamnose reductase